MLVQNKRQWNEIIRLLKRDSGTLVYDVETTGLNLFTGDRIVGVAMLVLPKGDAPRPFYVPFRHRRGTNLPVACFQELAPFFADPKRTLLGWRLKFDIHATEAEGLTVHNRQRDAMILAHLNNENERSLELKQIGARVDPTAADADKELQQLWKTKYGGRDNVKGHMGDLLPEDIFRYAEQDVWLTWRLDYYVTRALEQQGLNTLAEEMARYGQVIQKMERVGVRVDPDICQSSLEACRDNKARLLAEARTAAGEDFNPRSVPQLRRILGVHNTDRASLEAMDTPVATAIAEYRKWDRAETAYFGSYLEKMDENNRVHCSLEVTGTISSRLCCHDPNLQAVPRQSDIYKVRDVICAAHGYTLVSADYSQIELRVLAHYTQDPGVMAAFKGKKVDLHQQTADFLGISRDRGKTMNFSAVYGIGVPGIMAKWGYSEAKATQIVSSYRQRYPGVRKLYYHCQNYAEKHGYIPLWTGRRRHYGPGIETHKAMSNLIQGGVAEIMRVAIVRLDQLLAGTRARMVLQIHDDILFEVPDNEVHDWLPKIRAAMERFNFSVNNDPRTRVPIKVDIKYGKTWGGMHKWNPPKRARKKSLTGWLNSVR